MVIKTFSSKLVRLKLTMKRKIGPHHRNNLGSPLQMQNGHPVKTSPLSNNTTEPFKRVIV